MADLESLVSAVESLVKQKPGAPAKFSRTLRQLFDVALKDLLSKTDTPYLPDSISDPIMHSAAMWAYDSYVGPALIAALLASRKGPDDARSDGS